MTRRIVLRRNREDLHSYASAVQDRSGLSMEAAVATYLQGELLYALLHSGAAPWLAVTGGVALHRAHGSSRWHPNLDLVTDRAPGARETERWHEMIDFSIAKVYGLRWARKSAQCANGTAIFLAGELSWETPESLCAPIEVRLLKSNILILEPSRISAVHEVSPLPLAGMILHVEPLKMLLARTLVSANTDALSLARTIYDLSILNALQAQPCLASIRDSILCNGEKESQVAKRLRECVTAMEVLQQNANWTEYLAGELPPRPLAQARKVSPDMARSALGLLAQVADRIRI